ncbi:MAG TPA: glycosyltransferase family 1 protein, partial [Epsilonproteobacteria bacterium]|nr:glycosyltransferase family 1 protein [Campylobacterota bacterium]
ILKKAIEKEVEFYVVTSSSKKPCPNLKNLYNLAPIFKMKMPFYKELDLVFPSYSKMKELTDTIQPDIIHISTPGLVGLFGRSIAKCSNIPMVGTYHTDFPKFVYNNIPIHFVEDLVVLLMRFFYKNFQTLFVRSNAYVKVLEDQIGVAKNRITLLKAGIDTNKFNRNNKDFAIWKHYNIPEEHTKMLYVGRLSKEKNFPLLLELWKSYFMLSKNKDISLIVVGSGSLDEAMYAPYNVRFLGEKRGEALAKIYASSDIFLFPSNTDTLGQVVMEAMSSGLSVIVSNKGGPKTLIAKEKPSGYSIDTQEKEAWLEAIDTLVSDKNLREKMGKNGAEQIANMDIAQSFDAFMAKHKEYMTS